MAPQLEKGDKVYPLTKNLRTRQPSKGLDHVKVRPFLVKEQSRPVNYVLDLPKDARIHPKFHIKMLKPADPDTPLQTTFYYESEEENEFEVEKIVDSKQTTTTRFYLVKWLGYPDSENTLEPETNLTNCKRRIDEY
jgi:hypothetical protein